jgi:hypothetical protein
MPDVSQCLLNAASQANYGLDYPGGMRLASGLALDPNGICKTLYGKELGACYAELIGTGALGGQPGLLTGHALLCDGTSGCYASTPDAAALDIVGDIDIRIEYQQFQGGGTNQVPVGKWAFATNQRSYKLHLTFGVVAALFWSNDGTAELSDASPILPAGIANTMVRGTLDVVNGANHTSEIFAGSTLGVGTSLGATTTGANTAIFNSTAPLTVGAAGTTGTDSPFKGRITKMEIRNGIGGSVVANPNFSAQAPGTTSFVDGAGLTWTLNGTARIV